MAGGNKTQSAKVAKEYLAAKSSRDSARLLGRAVGGRRRRLRRSYTFSNPWESWEIRLLGKHTDQEVGRLTGRRSSAVTVQRKKLGVKAFNPPAKKWTAREDALLGRFPDAEVARRLGRTVVGVAFRRRLVLGIPNHHSKLRRWTPGEYSLLGTLPDAEVARRLGRSIEAVIGRRNVRRIHSFDPEHRAWTPAEDKLLGTLPDAELARRFDRPPGAVVNRRRRLGILSGRLWTPAEDAILRTVSNAGKISTREGTLLAEFTPTPKIIRELRGWFPRARLVGWKYEMDGDRAMAIQRAETQLAESNTDACVANGAAYGVGFGLVTKNGDCRHIRNPRALYAALNQLIEAGK